MKLDRFSRTRWTGAMAAIILAGATLHTAPLLSWSDVRGLFVYTLSDAIDKAPGVLPGNAVEITQALGVQGVDGLALVEDWWREGRSGSDRARDQCNCDSDIDASRYPTDRFDILFF